MKYFDINTKAKGNGWYRLKVTDATHMTLKTGKVVPTTVNMNRQASKIC